MLIGVLSSLIGGVNEILFLIGLGLLYSGLSKAFSVGIAQAVCGGLLLCISVWGAASGHRKGDSQ